MGTSSKFDLLFDNILLLIPDSCTYSKSIMQIKGEESVRK